MRDVFQRIATHAAEPAAPPATDVDRFWYGLAQPFLGLRTLWRTPSLRRRALVPAAVVLVIAAISVGPWNFVVAPGKAFTRYYATVAGLASLPALLFAGTYAQLAAEAHAVLGLGERAPLTSSFAARLKQLVQGAILVALGVLPFLVLLRLLPIFGHTLALGLSSAWTLHWIVIEALDGARVADPHPGEPSPPWFVAWTEAVHVQEMPAVGRLVRRFGAWVTRLSQPWHDEIALARRHPALAVGFALATAALLAIPVANLLLRPAILVGAVHLRGRLAQR
jgi:hypothetical protein